MGAALEIRIGWRAGRIEQVALRSQRADMGRLLPGRSPAEAVALLGRLYAVCGHAQRAAGELALAAALGHEPSAARRVELRLACAREAVQEHLWRVLVDWPKQLALGPAQERFAHWYRRCAGADGGWPAALLDELATDWLGCPVAAIGEWCDLRAFDAWAQGTTATLAPLFARLRAAAHAGAPPAPGDAAGETGPAVQHAEHPWIAALAAEGRDLEARVAARVVGLVAIAGEFAAGGEPRAALEFEAHAPAPGRGRAVVTTARGVLVHDVQVRGERIEHYAISTPTDRNFAAAGPYTAHVAGRAASSAAAAARIAGLWALALDPCVPYQVAVVGSTAHA